MLKENMDITQIREQIKENPNEFLKDINALLVEDVNNFTKYFDNKPEKNELGEEEVPHPNSQFKKYFNCSASLFLNILDDNNIQWIGRKKKFYFIVSSTPENENESEECIIDKSAEIVKTEPKRNNYEKFCVGNVYRENHKYYLKFAKELKERLDNFCDENDYIGKVYLTNRVIEEGLNLLEEGDKE